MPSEHSSDVRFEIGPVLFIDIIGYSPAAEIVLAQVEAQVGNVDDTIAALPQLLEVPNGLTPGILRIDPSWDPVPEDPRFHKLCEEKPK